MQLWESVRLLGLLKDCLQSTPEYGALLIIESLDSLASKDYEAFLETLSQCLPKRWRVLITAKAELLGSFSIGRVLDHNTEYNGM
jgi:hypothetical protein